MKNLTYKQLTQLLKKLHPNLNRNDLRVLAREVYKGLRAPELTVEHKDQKFVISQHTKDKTLIEGVEFSPLATDVFDAVLGYLINEKNRVNWGEHGVDMKDLDDNHRLMFDWLLCSNPDYIRALSKKYEQAMKKSKYQ